MDAKEPGAVLQQALQRFQVVGRLLRQQTLVIPPLLALDKAIAGLVPGMAGRALRCPADYVVAWQRYVLDPRQPVSARALRYLCWEPEVATEARFLHYLDTVIGTISTRSLQGLVWSCHARWSLEFAAGPIAQQVRQRLVAYDGDHLMMKHWRQHADVLLGPTGPRRLGTALLAMRSPVPVFCKTWAIHESSPYVLEVMRHALASCLKELVSDPALCSYLITTLLPWPGWTTRDFYMAIEATVRHSTVHTTAGMPEQLASLILADPRLGDPRLPQQEAPWSHLSQEARQRVVHWLSREDMRFFFDRVLPESKDQEERKTFWMRYTPRVLRSRPLLNAADSQRLHDLLQQIPMYTRHFGAVVAVASAFLIDFGPLVVVQVNALSEGCYVYGKRSFERLVADFWQASPLTLETLLVADHAAVILHHQTWEKDMAEILQQYDIRPTYTEYLQ